MDFNGLVESLTAQLAFVWHAPLPFLTAVGIAAVLIWRAMDWRYSATIERLRNQSPIDKSPVDVAKRDVDARQIVLRQAHGAKTQGRHSLSRPFFQTESEVWPCVRAAMLSLSKEFDLPLPPEGPNAKSSLAVGTYFLEQVVPLLQAGHSEEARATAKHLAHGE